MFSRTALMLAAESSALSEVEVLVRRGADLAVVDSDGHNVVYYATLSGNSETKTALLTALNRHQLSGKSYEKALKDDAIHMM